LRPRNIALQTLVWYTMLAWLGGCWHSSATRRHVTGLLGPGSCRRAPEKAMLLRGDIVLDDAAYRGRKTSRAAVFGGAEDEDEEDGGDDDGMRA
jgi:hypothetical protein